MGDEICSSRTGCEAAQREIDDETLEADAPCRCKHSVRGEHHAEIETRSKARVSRRCGSEADDREDAFGAGNEGEQQEWLRGSGIDGEIVTIEPESGEEREAPRAASSGSTVRARILWPALGFPAVIAPGSRKRRGGDKVHHAPRSVEPAGADERGRRAPPAVCAMGASVGRRHVAESVLRSRTT